MRYEDQTFGDSSHNDKQITAYVQQTCAFVGNGNQYGWTVYDQVIVWVNKISFECKWLNNNGKN